MAKLYSSDDLSFETKPVRVILEVQIEGIDKLTAVLERLVVAMEQQKRAEREKSIRPVYLEGNGE